MIKGDEMGDFITESPVKVTALSGDTTTLSNNAIPIHLDMVGRVDTPLVSAAFAEVKAQRSSNPFVEILIDVLDVWDRSGIGDASETCNELLQVLR